MKEDFKLMNLKGTSDFLPEEQIIRNRITDTLKKKFELYGFLPLETPILCYYDLLASKPVKLGRAREFYQCDVDACGVESPYAEIEYFMMSKEVFKEFNLDVEIRYNNRKFLSGLLEYVSVPKENIGAFITLIDKLDKLTRDDIESELEELSSKVVVDKVFKYFEYDLEMLTSELGNTNVEILTEGINELNSLDKLIKDLNLDLCKFTPFLARGLEIYTGTVWEIFDKTGEFKSALGGGGRYDKIITNFLHNGEEYPAIGMSFGLEPMYTLLKERESKELKKYDVYVYSFNNDKYLFEISNMLRQNNIKVLTELNNIKLKKAMNNANREKVDKVIIIGEDELKNNSVTLKDMVTGNQELVKIEDIVSKIKEM